MLRLDRLSHSMPHLVTLVEELRDQGIGFRSIGDGAIDTTTADGELVFLMLAIPMRLSLVSGSQYYLRVEGSHHTRPQSGSLLR